MTLRTTIACLACAPLLGIVLSHDAPAAPANAATTQQIPDENRDRGAIRIAPHAEPQAPPSVPAPGVNPLAAIPLAALAQTRDRPPFSPSRRPPPPELPVAPPVASRAAPVPDKPKRPQLALVGTVVGGAEAIGIFVEPGSKDIVRLRVGKGFEGWTLRSVERREATLASDDAAATLELPAPGMDAPGSEQAAAVPPPASEPRRRVHH